MADQRSIVTVDDFTPPPRTLSDLVRVGRDSDDLVREFGPTVQSVRAWVAQAEKREGRREQAVPILSNAERDELIRLRREVRHLRLERDNLSKAAAWLLGRAGR